MQEVSFETPGARDSMCVVDTGELTYKVYPPETTILMKTSDELVVECFADGNRHRKMVVHPVLSNNTLLNLGNGFIPGFVVDEHTRSNYIYPDIVAVDFTHIPFKKAEQPVYAQNPAAPNVEDIDPVHGGFPAIHQSDLLPPSPLEERESKAYLTETPDAPYYQPSKPAPIK